MYIILDENDIATNDICKSCNQFMLGRFTEVFDVITQRICGYSFICFKCFGARIKWKPSGKNKRAIWSPKLLFMNGKEEKKGEVNE